MFDEVVKIDPKYYDALKQKAHSLYQLKQYQQSKLYLQKCLDFQHNDDGNAKQLIKQCQMQIDK